MSIERRNIEFQATETRTETTEDGAKYIIGYAALVNSPSRPITENINGRQETFIETIDQRAFDNAVISDVVYLIDHDPAKLVGRQGANLEVKRTDKGLFFRSKVIDTTLSRDLYTAINEGLYKDNSFGFRVSQDEWSRTDGKLYRTIKEISQIVDVSTTIKGAYSEPFVFTRNLAEDEIKVQPETVIESTQESRNTETNEIEKDKIEFEFLKLKSVNFS
jgi:HK97 family phage prohead protease